MSVSFTWKIKTIERNVFRHGTSNDIATLDYVFPGREVSSDDIKILRAMHNASHSPHADQYDSLWKDIADKLEGLQGEDYDKRIELKIDTEF